MSNWQKKIWLLSCQQGSNLKAGALKDGYISCEKFPQGSNWTLFLF